MNCSYRYRRLTDGKSSSFATCGCEEERNTWKTLVEMPASELCQEKAECPVAETFRIKLSSVLLWPVPFRLTLYSVNCPFKNSVATLTNNRDLRSSLYAYVRNTSTEYGLLRIHITLKELRCCLGIYYRTRPY